MNISSRSAKLEWASLTHTIPHTAKKIRKVIERNNYILDTLQTEYTQEAFTLYNISPYVFNASEQICLMMILRVSNMHKAEQDLKAIMLPVYGTHIRLRTIRESTIQLTQNSSE